MDLDALCAIQTLIKFGIDSKRIVVFCEKNAVKCLNNPFVNEKMVQTLKELNVTINESYQMQEWNNGKWSSGKSIKNIHFQKKKSDDDDVQSPRNVVIECCVKTTKIN